MGKRREREGADVNGAKEPVNVHELLAKGVPPQNIDAERMVLGGILRNNDCLPDVVRRLKDDHFYHPRHQKIFACMVAMYDDGRPVDTVTLVEELSKNKLLKDIGGAPHILELFNETLTAANVMHHVDIVFQKAVLRRLIGTGTDLLRDAYGNTSDADE